jgi:hypothetical protein
MSFIESFTIGYKLRKDRLKKTIDNFSEKQSKINNLLRTRTYTRKGNLSAQLAQKLVSLGYHIDSIMALMKIHNFSNVEEALNLLEKDPVTNLYNHYFYPQAKSKSSFAPSQSEQNILKNNKIKDERKCLICGGNKDEHIDEKDEYNKELTKVKKNYERSQYYEAESLNINKIPIIEKKNMKIKINAIERVRTIGNNLNKDNKNLIFNLNNNIHEYYVKSNNDNNNIHHQDNHDCSQSNMIFHNPKAQSGTINSLLLLNHQTINNNNKSFNILENHNNLKTFDDNSSINNGLGMENNITNTDGSKNLVHKRISKELSTESKIELNKENNIIDNKNEIKEIKDDLINVTSKYNDTAINIDINDDLNAKLKKYGIKQETINQFKDPDICNICFENKANKDNIAQKCCLHYFCDQCINKYLTYQINNGNVLEIKCLMAGCPHLYTSEEIRVNVSNEIYRKYLRFYGIQIKIRNPQKTYINCPFVDCDELVDVTNIFEGNVICGVGHVFCRECLKIGGHSKANSVCKKNELNLDIFNELKQKNPSKIHQNYKQCPECRVLIEKNDGCNQMKCLNCGYSFCWLCLREYTYNHYSIYNVKGCPGMRFESVKTYKIRNNACLNFLWYMLSCFLYILFFISIYIFYLFAGCPYEFVKCYLERKQNKGNESKSNLDSIEIYEDNVNELGIGIGIGENGINSNQSNNMNAGGEEKEKNSKTIIWLLIFLGILCQPLYLSFYAIYTLIECYKRFNCMFYFPR